MWSLKMKPIYRRIFCNKWAINWLINISTGRALFGSQHHAKWVTSENQPRFNHLHDVHDEYSHFSKYFFPLYSNSMPINWPIWWVNPWNGKHPKCWVINYFTYDFIFWTCFCYYLNCTQIFLDFAKKFAVLCSENKHFISRNDTNNSCDDLIVYLSSAFL